MDTLTLLKTLTTSPGPSGRETTAQKILQMQWDSLADEVHTDAMGNLIALQRGQGTAPRPSVMVAAHIDEIGLIVTGIEGEFLRIHAIGGIDRRVLLGLEVIVHGQRPLPGIIGARPPHVLPPEERDKILPWKQIFVDVGLPAEEVKTLVRVGDHVTLERDLVELQEGLIAGKALDNRASVAAVTIALELLTHRQHTWDFYAVATVQEEVGTKGAITSAYNLIPQLAVALDVTFATQHNDSQTGTFELDKGPTIGIGPNFHPQVVARLKNTAETEEIPYQLEPVPGHSGTDAWSIQVARAGIPTGLLSIPVRYMHQPVETAALRDIERTGRWLASFIAGLEEDFCPRWEDDDVEDNTDMEGD